MKQLILFGSRAKGSHTTWSDYDVCVVSDDFKGLPPWQRMEIVLEAWGGERALEPICFTTGEFRELDTVWRTEPDKGIVLYT